MYLMQAFKFTSYLLICGGDNFIFIRGQQEWSVDVNTVKLLLGEGKKIRIALLNGNATFLSTWTENWGHFSHLEMEIGTNLRLGARDREMEGRGPFQSLNIEADVKSNGTDEGTSVDVIVMKIRAGEEMHNRRRALGHGRPRFIKAGVQAAAAVKTKYLYNRYRSEALPGPGSVI